MRLCAVIPVFTIFFASSAYAKCEDGSKTLFSCTTQKGKKIEVCDAQKTIQYSFGRPQRKPEIVLSIPRNQVSTYQWNGMGSHISYSVNVPNGNTVYNVFYAMDRLTEEHSIEAGVNVIINGKQIATVQCLEKNLVANLEGVDLKLAE